MDFVIDFVASQFFCTSIANVFWHKQCPKHLHRRFTLQVWWWIWTFFLVRVCDIFGVSVWFRRNTYVFLVRVVRFSSSLDVCWRCCTVFLTFFHVRLDIMGNWQQVVVSRHFSLRVIYRVRLARMCFMDREDVTAPFCLANSRYLLRIYACFCSECRGGFSKAYHHHKSIRTSLMTISIQERII